MSEVSDSFAQLAKGGFLTQLDPFTQDTKLDLKDYFEGRPLAKLPKAIAEQIESEKADAQDSADDAQI